MYYLGRIVGAFFNQLFRFLFWNKKGQKILFIAVIFVIAVCFIKLGEVAAVEEVVDTNQEVYSYYNSVVNDAIVQLQNYFNANGTDNNLYRYIIGNQSIPYFFYGNSDGSSYNGATPLSNNYINIVVAVRPYNYTKTASNYDYRGITGVTQYEVMRDNNTISVYRFNNQGVLSTATINKFYAPLILFPYLTDNWVEYRDALINGDTSTIVSLLEDIKEEQQLINENLTNDDVSNVSADLPQDTAVDPTDSLWGDMFDQVRTAVTSTSVSPISITIPFIDYSVVIEPAIYSPMTRIRNIMRPLYDFIILSWWFGASMWIVKDIHKYLEQIKNGDITAKDTNIKTEVL